MSIETLLFAVRVLAEALERAEKHKIDVTPAARALAWARGHLERAIDREVNRIESVCSESATHEWSEIDDYGFQPCDACALRIAALEALRPSAKMKG
jgi:hypothetical protein